MKMWDKDAKFFGIGHNDLWSNNLLFSQDKKRVVLIDFQNLDGRHMAFDFWYFLYTSTDSNWRAANLDHCFSVYFDVLKGYLGKHMTDMSLEDLKNEFQSLRVLCGAFWGATFNLATTLSPHELKEQDTMGVLGKKIYEKKKTELGSPPSKNDHPMITEMRRRVLDSFMEMADLGFI